MRVRSLISEGRLRHGTVESTSEGFQRRIIEREGPTGLLVTTTALKLEPELETRMLSIPINDSREQTGAILAACASKWDRSANVTPVDAEQWHALQTWLESAERRVKIPFAADLMKAIPPVAVRLRRDGGMLMSLIASHALLHQKQRDIEDGWIVATLDDYAAVYALVVDLVSEGVGASVSATVRQTVEAVQALGGREDGHSVTRIKEHLKLDKSTVSRRVRDACKLGYLRNLNEGKKGVEAMIVLGDPLPDEVEVLPRPGVLQCCSVIGGRGV